jgi:hypothetical protein
MGANDRKPWVLTFAGVALAICSAQSMAQQSVPSAPAAQSPAAAAAARAANAATASDPAKRGVSLNAALTAASPVVTLEALSSMRMLEQLRELQAKVLALNPPPPAPAQAQPPKPSASAPPPASELLALQKVLEPAAPAPPRLNRVAAIYGPQYALKAEIIKPTGEVIVVKPGAVHEGLRILNITPDLVELEVRTPAPTPVPGAGAQKLTSPTDQSQAASKRRRATALAAATPPATAPSSEVLVLRLRVGATFE